MGIWVGRLIIRDRGKSSDIESEFPQVFDPREKGEEGKLMGSTPRGGRDIDHLGLFGISGKST